LAAVTSRIKHGSTDVNQANAQDSNYQAAQVELATLKADRDALQKRMADEEMTDAIMPASVTVAVIDSAETPPRPSSPNTRLAAWTMEGGMMLVLAGLALWGLSLPRKTA
jgi:uncharacterized protein involved in exopolysaccharide biosynthesis